MSWRVDEENQGENFSEDHKVRSVRFLDPILKVLFLEKPNLRHFLVFLRPQNIVEVRRVMAKPSAVFGMDCDSLFLVGFQSEV